MFAVLPWYHAIPKDGHPGDVCVTSNGSGTYHLACRGGVLELQLGGPLPLEQIQHRAQEEAML